METIFNSSLSNVHTINSKRAKIITIEGIDGAGKTTIVENCVKLLNQCEYRTAHFFTSSDFNIYWETVKRGKQYGCINNDMNQLLHNIAFLTYLNSIFADLLNEYDYVISEWYIYGKMVLSELYTENPNNNSLVFLQQEFNSGNIICPDYSFFIDTEPVIARDRILKRNHQLESKETLEMLTDAYHLWDKYIEKYSIEKIDGNLPIDTITSKILKKVLENEK